MDELEELVNKFLDYIKSKNKRIEDASTDDLVWFKVDTHTRIDLRTARGREFLSLLEEKGMKKKG